MVRNFKSIKSIDEDLNYDDWNNRIKSYYHKTGKLKIPKTTYDSFVAKPSLDMDVKKNVTFAITYTENNEEKVNVIGEFFDNRKNSKVKNRINELRYIYSAKVGDELVRVLSLEKLKNCPHRFKGIFIEDTDNSLISKDLSGLNMISRIFIAFEVESAIKIKRKSEIIRFSKYMHKNFGWDKKGFLEWLLTHPTEEYVFLQTDRVNDLILAFLFSGEFQGYPMHLMIMGPPGSGKTKILECLNSRMEEPPILELGNSTIKSFIPSFKGSIVEQGYFLRCYRLTGMDELYKMLSSYMSQTNFRLSYASYLSNLNMLLDHSIREIGSGNCRTIVQATAKAFICGNHLNKYDNLSEHLGIIDSTTLSRFLIYCQTSENIDFINKNKLFLKENKNSLPKNGELINFEEELLNPLLTLYDSCKEFLIDFDEKRINNLLEGIKKMAPPKMRPLINSRMHHTLVLLLDGIVKVRCLFEDFDDSFKVSESDYKKLEEMIFYIAESWKIDMSGWEIE
jgi:hypothetical protein